MRFMRLAVAAMAISGLLTAAVVAGVASAVVRETAEALLSKTAKTGAREGTEQALEKLTVRLTRLAEQHGDEALAAVRRGGVPALEAIEAAGARGKDVIRLFATRGEEAVWVAAKSERLAVYLRYGDDAAEAMLKHQEIAVQIIERFGAPGAKAMCGLSGQSARRLAMMQESGELASLGQSERLLDVIGRYGDKAMDFIWKNKGALAVGATLTAFVADPEPFLNTAGKLGEKGLETVGQPLASAAGEVAKEAGRQIHWTLVVIVGMGLVAIGLAWWRRGRRKLAST